MAEGTQAAQNGASASPNTLNGGVVEARTIDKIAKWTLADDEVMFDVLLEAKQRAGISHNGFTRDTWQDVAEAVTRFTTIGAKKDVENCKSRFQRLRKDYKAIRWLKDQPGFQWDPVNFVVVAGDDCWEAWLAEHPEHQKYRFSRFPQYDAMATIADDELPPGHLPIRPRPRPGGMFSHITGASGPSPFGPSPFAPMQTPMTLQSQQFLQQHQSAMMQPMMQFVDPTTNPHMAGPSTHPMNDVASAISDEDTADLHRRSRSVNRRPRKRRRTLSDEERGASQPHIHLDESFSRPLADALRALKESADDYVNLLRSQREAIEGYAGPSSYSHSLSHERRSTAIALALENEWPDTTDVTDPTLSEDRVARLIRAFERNVVYADTYVQLVRKGVTAAGIRRKWIDQLLSDSEK